jgi:hypothetical protein
MKPEHQMWIAIVMLAFMLGVFLGTCVERSRYDVVPVFPEVPHGH